MATLEQTDSLDGAIQTLLESSELHADIHAVGVTVAVLWHIPQDGKDEPLTFHGTPCYAFIKISGKQQRALGIADAVMTIDQAKWKELGEARRRALLAHELFHLTVARDVNDQPKRDDFNRPVLRCRPHDIQIGWFRAIAAEYGDTANEVVQAREMVSRDRQFFFSFIGDVEVTPPSKNRPTKKQAAAAIKAAMAAASEAEGSEPPPDPGDTTRYAEADENGNFGPDVDYGKGAEPDPLSGEPPANVVDMFGGEGQQAAAATTGRGSRRGKGAKA